MSQATTVREVLTAARWMLDNVGWCKGFFSKYPSDSAYSTEAVPCAFCATGAIWEVKTTPGLRSQALQTMESLVGYIPSWNDDFTRTKEQVLAMFDRAIEQA